MDTDEHGFLAFSLQPFPPPAFGLTPPPFRRKLAVMAWNKTMKVITAGTVSIVLLAVATKLFIHYNDPQRKALALGEKIIAKHLAEPLDMTASYTTPASYFDKITAYPAWSAVPTGSQTFRNVPLQIDGMICLWGEGNASKGLNFPEELLGIQVKQKFETLYVYHACFYASPNGTPVAEVVFRYDDGSSATNQILFGDDTLDWYAKAAKNIAAPTAARSKIAWHGEFDNKGKKQPLRFCLTAIANPEPSLEVTSIDLYSTKSRTAWCLMAFTPGKAGLMK